MKTFVLLGRSGVGKSSFINATFGKALARTDPYSACTKVVKYYGQWTAFGDVCLIDTPGLADEGPSQDRKYLKAISDSVDWGSVDATFYVSRLDETRFRAEDRTAIEMMSEVLGCSIWTNAWAIFTFSASVDTHRRDEALWKRVEQIEDHIGKVVKRSGHSCYHGFKRYVRVDNVVSNWSIDTVPIAKLLCER